MQENYCRYAYFFLIRKSLRFTVDIRPNKAIPSVVYGHIMGLVHTQFRFNSHTMYVQMAARGNKAICCVYNLFQDDRREMCERAITMPTIANEVIERYGSFTVCTATAFPMSLSLFTPINGQLTDRIN